MTVDRIHYEELLAEFSNASAAIALLKQHRPYLELLPSMRRPQESLISIPLPVVKLRRLAASVGPGIGGVTTELLRLPCDLGMLMCDPEWKIKTGVEIFVFIHRPQEDFSDLLGRWRQTQVILSQDYAWEMPLRYTHILSEGANNIYPLFVLLDSTPERIKQGLKGAYLPFVIRSLDGSAEKPTHLASDEIIVAENREESGR